MNFAIFAGLSVFVFLRIKKWGVFTFKTRALAGLTCLGLTLASILLLTTLGIGTQDWHFVLSGFWVVFIIKLTHEFKKAGRFD